MPDVPDYSDPTPARRQIAADLRGQIRAGTFAPGSRLPSNLVMAQHYGVAAETIRSALDELRGEGFIATQSTRGTFVVDKLPAETPDLKALTGEVAELAERVKEYDDLRARVGRIEAILVNLHSRLGFPNPFGGAHDSAEKAPGRRQARR